MADNRKNKSSRIWTILIIILLIILCAGIFFFLQFGNFTKTIDTGLDSEPAQSAAPSSAAEATAEADATEKPSPDELADALNALDTMEEINGTTSLPDYPVSDQRVTYQDGFYYEPVDGNTALMDRIRNLSYNESINTKMAFDKLSYVRVKYINFQDQEDEGEIICSKHIAQDLVEIFYELYLARYQIERIHLVDDYGADDAVSMAANNTSAFNYRLSTGTTDDISEHSWGVCIDINPLYNPYVAQTENGTVVEPADAAPYADRTQSFPHKIDENDLCYQLFTQHGFQWGGNWNSVKDYQHFQKDID